MRTARAVGAETAARTGAPIIAAFCTISIEIAARQHYESLARARALAGERASELVERIVAPDVLAQGDQPALGLIEAGGMHGARLMIEHLHGRERLDRGHDLVRREAYDPRRPWAADASLR